MKMLFLKILNIVEFRKESNKKKIIIKLIQIKESYKKNILYISII